MNWLPIDTAPTDGTPFLAYVFGGAMYVCWKEFGDWVFFRSPRGVFSVDPSHWMPLPDSPTEEKQS